MSQEMNKKAVADLFCIEDARAVCEAIGGLGLNPGDENTDEPLEYTPDNILDVTVNENPDGMPAFPQVGQTEMDDETKAFVVDELSKQLQADGRESLSDEDLVPFAVKIKGENHISQDLVSFIDQLTSGADARLATQNTSEAQPNGVATDLTNGGEGAAPAPADSGLGPDGLPPEAPGGLVEPAEAPALDTNPDDGLGLGAEPAAAPAPEGDFNLDVPEPGTEVGAEGGEGEGDFNLDIPGEDDGTAPADAGTDTIGELNFGDDAGAGEGGEEAPAEGGEAKEEDKPAETESVEVPAEPVTECGAEAPAEPVTECGAEAPAEPVTESGAEAPAEPVTECGTEAPAEPVTECGDAEKDSILPAVTEGEEGATDDAGVTEEAGDEMLGEAVDAKLESIKANYVETLARERVRAVVESYQHKRDLAEKQALCESIIANYNARKESEERKAVVESTMGDKIDELGDKLAAMCEGQSGSDELDAKLESIVGDFKAAKANEAASKDLDAKLESIVAKFAAGKEADKKLDAIVESVKTPKEDPVEAPKAGLDAKLESIIAEAKKKIAAAK